MFFFFKQKTAYEILSGLVGSEMCIRDSIRVNAIGPGPTLQNKAQTEDEFKLESNSTLLGKGSSPDNLLGAALYLLGAEAVTGQMLTVDGGQHLA